ncbi:MAG TPA: hypothetical protein VIP78_13590 [Candidatus Dormibacteraeota bacterium]|jgi:hypothetical protein
MPASIEAWATWMGSWIASHWGSEALPALRVVIRLYDAVERGKFERSGELRLWMDGWGLTPNGQQGRRWLPPKPEELPNTAPMVAPDRYGHLHAIQGKGA